MQPSVDFDQSPLVAIWETTRACDLACVHCRASANAAADPRQLTTPEAERLLEQLRELRPGVLVLTGGDPLKRADLLPLVRQAVASGLSVAITPSVTPLLTEAAIQSLANAGVSRVALSLDGPEAEVHDSFRGMPGAFAATLEAIRHVRAAGLPLQVNTSLSASTFHHLASLGRLVADIGPVLWSVFFVVPVGRAKQSQQLSAEACESAFHYLYEWSITHGLAARAGLILPRSMMARGLCSYPIPAMSTPAAFCRSRWATCATSPWRRCIVSILSCRRYAIPTSWRASAGAARFAPPAVARALAPTLSPAILSPKTRVASSNHRHHPSQRGVT